MKQLVATCVAGLLACASATSGCTDNLATNYNASAVVDSGTCQYDCARLIQAVGAANGTNCYVYSATGIVSAPVKLQNVGTWNKDLGKWEWKSDKGRKVNQGESWIIQGVAPQGFRPGEWENQTDLPNLGFRLEVRGATIRIRRTRISGHASVSHAVCLPLTRYVLTHA